MFIRVTIQFNFVVCQAENIVGQIQTAFWQFFLRVSKNVCQFQNCKMRFGTANFNSHSCDKVLPVLDQSDEECKHSMGNILQLTWSFLELVASYDFQRHSHLGKPGKSGNFSQIGDTPPSPNPHWGILPFIFGHLHLLKAEEKIPPCFDKIPTFSDFILSRWERRP